MLQSFSRSKQPSQRSLHTILSPQSCWMHCVRHIADCAQGSYVVCSCKGLQWCGGTYVLPVEIKGLVVEWTGALVEFVIATMIVTAAIAKAAAWSYGCAFIQQFRPATSYKLLGWQDGMASISKSQKHWLDNLIKAFQSCKHPCCSTSCFSKMSLYRTWKIKDCEVTTNPQSRGV